MTTKKKARDPWAVKRGELMRSARAEKGLSQARVATLVGVERESVSQWESGDVVEIKASNAIKLMKILGISLREITPEAVAYLDSALLSTIIEVVDEVVEELHWEEEWSYNMKAGFITQVYEEYLEKGKEALTKDNVITFAKFARKFNR